MGRLAALLLAGGIALGTAASAAALYGRYRVLPAALTGPHICRLEAGGCQVLFRTPTAALLGVPNSALGLLFNCALLLGLARGWPRPRLFLGASGALAMSGYLARALVVQRLECRVCWAGHVANLAIWLGLLIGLSGSTRRLQ
jgi:uncharacterized membrane protein